MRLIASYVRLGFGVVRLRRLLWKLRRARRQNR